LKGGKKVGDEFLCLQLKFFYCSKEFVLKGDRKWVMLCLVFSLFTIGLFYCSKMCFLKEKENRCDVVFGVFLFAIELFYYSRVFFEKRKKVGDVMFGVFFVCN
jgi:hypothetical protein